VSRKTLGLNLKKSGAFWRVAMLISLAFELSPFLKDVDPKVEGEDI